jgi:membrane protease YdiL (CAAX protease family)
MAASDDPVSLSSMIDRDELIGGISLDRSARDALEIPLYKFGSQESRSAAVLHTALVLVAALFMANFVVLAGYGILQSAGFVENADPVLFGTTGVVLNFVGLGAVALGYLAWQTEAIVFLSRPTRRDIGMMIVGFGVLVVAMVSFELLMDFLNVDRAENVAIEDGREHPELFLMMLPIQFIFTAPVEELLFRGLIQGLFRRAYGIVPGILLASAIFGLFHYPALAGNDGIAPVLAILVLSGIILGALYELTGNLLVPIVAHACWNVAVFATEYLDTTGSLVGTL